VGTAHPTKGHMIDTNELYKKLNIDKNLVAEFSIIFSSFEFVLKRVHVNSAKQVMVSPLKIDFTINIMQ